MGGGKGAEGRRQGRGGGRVLEVQCENCEAFRVVLIGSCFVCTTQLSGR